MSRNNMTRSGQFSVIAEISEYYTKAIDGDAIVHLPPGYRFQPSDQEIVMEYLKRKNENKRLPPHQIMDVDVYRYAPDEIAESYDQMNLGNVCYFFTSLHKYINDGIIQISGDGYWKETGRGKAITHQGRKVGSMKVLVYFRGKPSTGVKTNWIIHEFRVDDAVLQNAGMNDWALCKIYEEMKHDLLMKEDFVGEEEEEEDDDDD